MSGLWNITEQPERKNQALTGLEHRANQALERHLRHNPRAQARIKFISRDRADILEFKGGTWVLITSVFA